MSRPAHVLSALSPASVEALRSLIGKTIHTLFADKLSIAGGHVATRQLSMLVDRKSYLVFQCEWSETPHFLMDSWIIEVKPASTPADIAVDHVDALVNPSQVSMWGATAIECIDIYSFHDEFAKDELAESVNYDGMLLFHCESERQFVIGCQLNGPGLAEDMHFSEERGTIQAMLDEGTLRATIS